MLGSVGPERGLDGRERSQGQEAGQAGGRLGLQPGVKPREGVTAAGKGRELRSEGVVWGNRAHIPAKKQGRAGQGVGSEPVKVTEWVRGMVLGSKARRERGRGLGQGCREDHE